MVVLSECRKRPKLVGSGIDANAAFFVGRGIEMENGRRHRYAAMGKVAVILVHRERRPALGRLDEHLVVVELDVRPDQAAEHPGQPRIDQQPSEGCRAELDVVRMFEPGALVGDAAPGGVGWSLARSDGVDLRTQSRSFIAGDEAADEDKTVLVVKTALIRRQARRTHLSFLQITHLLPFQASQIAAVHEKSSPPLPLPSTGLNAS